MRSSTLSHDAHIALPTVFDISWFEAMKAKDITPEHFPDNSEERIAYKEYLDNLQVIALGSVKQP